MQDRDSKYYVIPGITTADDRTFVLKHDSTFGVFDRHGDVGIGHGLFHDDTRYLSRLVLTIEEDRPLLLGSSGLRETDTQLVVHLTNPDMELPSGEKLARGTLHIARSKLIWEAACHEKLRIFSYAHSPVTFRLRLGFGADFADIFEARGTFREKRGTIERAVEDGQSLLVRYHSLDGQPRAMRLSYSTLPSRVRPSELEFELTLLPNRAHELHFAVSCETSHPRSRQRPAAQAMGTHHEEAARALSTHVSAARSGECEVVTTSARFNEWLTRSLTDLRMMMTDLPEAPYPFAGVPWYSTAFGRDGIITAFETLWVDPRIARGVLRYLAATQATDTDPKRAAEPGKILHEMRRGEMANLGEVPFGRYYGTVDATPLFVMLAGATYEATADRALVEELWPHVERALAWIETRGDMDGDGFVEYRGDPGGLIQQGWKDSADSVFYSDGKDAKQPIALCEVQAYVYGALRAAASLASMLGKLERARRWDEQAARLAERFEQAFWCDDLGTYALALDGDKRPCRVRTSNAGHCLFSGIASEDHARELVRTLFSADSFSGWGIRTVASGEPRYNPMSYHNGSIWPHDNALIAAGLARYGFRQEALQILMALHEATIHFQTNRLPELFCGFERRPDEPPTVYPVACSPQAWAAGTPFMLLQACLGLSIDAPRRRVAFCHPVLPPFVQELRLHGLPVGGDSIDLILHRYPEDVGINVLRRTGSIEVVNVK